METLKPEKSEKEKIQILQENLKILDVLDKYSILGHGTSSEAVALSIMSNGLKSRSFLLDSTNCPLFDSSLSYDAQPDEYFRNILHWPHLNSKIIIVIAVPNPEDNVFNVRSYFNNILEELPNDEKVAATDVDLNYIISPEFIKGYIDVNKLNFVPNLKYNPDKKVQKKNKNYHDSLKYHRGTNKNDDILIPSPSPLDENNDDIW